MYTYSMKVGLVHGRFQPFHNGHKFLVDKMLSECDKAVILIGSATKEDIKNPFTLEQRINMIKEVFNDNQKLKIGANIDLDEPHSPDAQWDIVFASCVLTLTGHLPTDVYGGDQYSVPWDRVKVEIHKFDRFEGISATQVRELMANGKSDIVAKKVPKAVYQAIKSI